MDSSLPVFDETVFVAELDAAQTPSAPQFYAQLAEVLHFPEHFGGNLDALFDCLTDLEHLAEPRIALIIQNADALLLKEKPKKRQAVIHTLREAENPENRYDDKIFTTYFV
jgi:RNAse (barnase) inhibitor barstar